jgi:hypothetical protein
VITKKVALCNRISGTVCSLSHWCLLHCPHQGVKNTLFSTVGLTWLLHIFKIPHERYRVSLLGCCKLYMRHHYKVHGNCVLIWTSFRSTTTHKLCYSKHGVPNCGPIKLKNLSACAKQHIIWHDCGWNVMW